MIDTKEDIFDKINSLENDKLIENFYMKIDEVEFESEGYSFPRSDVFVKYIPEKVKLAHPEICIEAVKNDVNSIRYIPKEVRKTYPEIYREVLDNMFELADEDIICENSDLIEYILKDVNEKMESENEINSNWQSDCLSKIKDSNNVILASPTGSGKTNVFLEWAKEKKEKPIYITAPIKALSNQRWRELKEQGYIVGLETGDIKNVPENCDFICCTQEIYTNKYMDEENATLIMDEFHYIFENSDRARSYIDALNQSKAKNILLCSATFGDINKLKEYCEKVSKRSFQAYEGKSRLTSLYYDGYMSKDEIENSLVITFSKRNIDIIVNKLAYDRGEYLDEDICDNINEIAGNLGIKIDSGIVKNAKKGLAGYYGGLLPKEKLFIEQCFEQGLIDTVVGTDALAMGVNFPVENVVFTQLAKYYDGPISKNLFEQLAGRAGRKGYFDEGYVYYCNDFTNDYGYPLEARDFSTSTLYYKWLVKDNEDISIRLQPKIKDILTGNTTIDEETSYIVKYSTNDLNFDYEKEKIEKRIDYIQNYDLVENVINDEFRQEQDDYDEYNYNDEINEEIQQKINDRRRELGPFAEEFYENIAKAYFEEFDVEKNCELFQNILLGKSFDEIKENNVESFQDLLQLRKYLMKLPKEYRKNYNFKEIESKINNIDETALNIDRGYVSVSAIDRGTKREQLDSDAMREAMKRFREDLEIEEKYSDLIDYWDNR